MGGAICKISLVYPIVFLNRGSDTPTFQWNQCFVRVLVWRSDFSCQGKMPRWWCAVATKKWQRPYEKGFEGKGDFRALSGLSCVGFLKRMGASFLGLESHSIYVMLFFYLLYLR